MKFLASASLAAILAAGSTPAQIEVPGDYATLQAAITAAAPGSTIVVTTPVLQGPIVIDKPLTIIGDPVANLGTEGPCFSPIPVPIELAGPGGGTKKKPVGLIFIGVSTPGRTEVTEHRFGSDRLSTKRITANKALNALRKLLM